MSDLWRRFREEHPEVPAKQIEDLWRQYAAQHGTTGATAPEGAPKRRGRPPGSKNQVTEPAE